MFMKKIVKKFVSSKNVLFPNMNNKMRLHYAKGYETKAIQENTILYETRDGKSIVDSPYAMFLYLATSSEFTHFKHVWVIHKKNEGLEESIPEELKEKVTFVYRQTLEYVDALLEAKYLISNSTFESFFVKRPGQVYINTWHGTPLKLMGFDIPGDISHSQNVLRNFLMTDYILSPNEHTSNIFINSYKLKGLYQGEILEGGYPRVDLTLRAYEENVYNKIEKNGCRIDKNKPIILYSPTWKGASVHDVNDDIEQIILETRTLINRFKNEYQILLKVHPFIFPIIKDEPRVIEYLVSDMIDANEVLSVTDILITDYSSIFFDFLVTDKPIIFYAWDKDLYEEERGLYLSENQLPGPIAENLEELISMISNINTLDYKEKYGKLKAKMTPHETGETTKGYVEYIFGNKQPDNNIKRYMIDTQKKKILFFPGGMRNNGITSSFLNLIDNIDYDNYDVTVLLNPSNDLEINNNFKLMNSNVRPLFRFGIDILTRKEKLLNKRFADRGVSVEDRNKYPLKGYQREARRLTAALKFDVAIDFSGYSYFWGRHILGVDAKKHLVFMHNDLLADSMREIDGERPMFKDLNGLFSIYYQFDRLLSVSPMTQEVNASKLSRYVRDDQMSFVYNTINIDNILNPTKEKKDEHHLKVARRLLRTLEEGDIYFYKNIEDIRQGNNFKYKVQKNSDAIGFASYEFNSKIFVKVSIEGTYIGWAEESHFDFREVITYSVQNFNGYGTVSRFLNSPIWKKIKTNTTKDQVITYVKPFKNRYVQIKKVADTSDGRYYYVKYKGEKLGWVKSSAVQRVHKISKYSPVNLYFYQKMKIMESENPVTYPEQIEWVFKYGKLKDFDSVALYSEPEGVTGGVELSLPFEYKDQIFEIKEITEFDNKRFCRLSLPGQESRFVGHVNEKNIEYVSPITNTEINSIFGTQQNNFPEVDTDNQPIPVFDKKYFNFVNMGRLSPEKNQQVLISAFKRFHEEYPDSRLYILGKGPLEDTLRAHIIELEMTESVFLLGHIPAPYNFMKQTDCFVLPSLYEGQPMVLLEALTLGMKILASNIPANINVVGIAETYGLLTEGTSIEAVYNGLVRIRKNDKPFEVFDYREYNQDAINSFYKEIN